MVRTKVYVSPLLIPVGCWAVRSAAEHGAAAIVAHADIIIVSGAGAREPNDECGRAAL